MLSLAVHAGRELPQQERRAATPEPTNRGRGRLGPRAGNPKRTRPDYLEKRYSRTSVGIARREGAQRPQCAKERGPKDPGIAAPLAAAGCRGNCWYNTFGLSHASACSSPSSHSSTSPSRTFSSGPAARIFLREPHSEICMVWLWKNVGDDSWFVFIFCA